MGISFRSVRSLRSTEVRKKAKAGLVSLAFATALSGLQPEQAKAAVINVSGQDWDVTSMFISEQDLLQELPVLQAQVWWGDASKAQEFADTLADQLGLPNYNSDWGPLFGFEESRGVIPNAFVWKHPDNFSSQTLGDYTGTWALASPISPPQTKVPAPLPVLGAATAFSGSRRIRKALRQRQQASGN